MTELIRSHSIWLSAWTVVSQAPTPSMVMRISNEATRRIKSLMDSETGLGEGGCESGRRSGSGLACRSARRDGESQRQASSRSLGRNPRPSRLINDAVIDSIGARPLLISCPRICTGRCHSCSSSGSIRERSVSTRRVWGSPPKWNARIRTSQPQAQPGREDGHIVLGHDLEREGRRFRGADGCDFGRLGAGGDVAGRVVSERDLVRGSRSWLKYMR